MRLFPPTVRNVALSTLVGIALLAIWVSRRVPQDRRPDPSVEELKTDLDLARNYITAQVRREQILREIESLGPHAWAGEYVADNYERCGSVEERESISIAPRGGFVWTYQLAGNHPAARFAYGDVVSASANSIRVDVASDRGIRHDRGERWRTLNFPLELIPVRWGERRYLVPANRVVELCNDYNWGCSRMRYFLPLLGGGSNSDERDRVDGVPILPPPYARWVLSTPIRARVTALSEPKVVESFSTSHPPEFTYECGGLIDAGALDGLVPGMELTPCRSCMPCSVVEALEHSARIEFLYLGNAGDRIADRDDIAHVGRELSTRRCK
jgi:hypothetical protein